MVKRKDGRWQEAVTIGGKRRYVYGRTRAEVTQKLRTMELDAKNGKLFKVVAEEWWAEKEPELAHNTAKSYKPAMDRAVEEFGERRMRELTPLDISRFIKRFAKTKADKTVRTQLGVINMICIYAVDWGYLDINIARDVSVPSGLSKERRMGASDDDIERVKASVDCTFGLFAFMAIYTGMRRGELLALEWEDIDLNARMISVNKSLEHISNRPHVKPPKTAASAASVPILEPLYAELIKRRGKGKVFPNADGDYLTETQYQRQWELYAQESGVTATAHQFRHSYATMLYEQGVAPEIMQMLLRHAQLSTTMDVYREIRDSARKSVFDSLGDIDYGKVKLTVSKSNKECQNDVSEAASGCN